MNRPVLLDPLPGEPAGIGVTGGAIVLLVVLVLGIAAGRAPRRFLLVLAGLIAVAVFGVAVTGFDLGPTGMGVALAVVLPLAVTFLAGWLAARGTWLWRFVVVGAAAVLLAAVPYAQAGHALARWVTG